MAKKSKVPKPASEPVQGSETTKKRQQPDTSEIDDIFSTKKAPTDDATTPSTKRTKAAGDNAAQQAATKSPAAGDAKRSVRVVGPSYVPPPASSSEQSSKIPLVQNDDGFFDSRGSGKKRFTEDGFPLYTVEDLQIGLGGDTPDCPFDCQCCF
ncbi:hypothetical protein H4R34_001632 [Dimargaris verticillata]|uniref:DUF1764-domain-containing protein n=1 Tax=Dimargaris verticillata TaxID=2761393 RepID=A0A9W8B384_9FUNG|nr:hypothetical protein H4R34_001632 [Dimargaris verticillata]